MLDSTKLRKQTEVQGQQCIEDVLEGLRSICRAPDSVLGTNISSFLTKLSTMQPTNTQDSQLIAEYKTFCSNLLIGLNELNDLDYQMYFESNADFKAHEAASIATIKRNVETHVRQLEQKLPQTATAAMPAEPAASLHTDDGRTIGLSRHENGKLAFHFENQAMRDAFFNKFTRSFPSIKNLFLLIEDEPNVFCLNDEIESTMDFKRGEVNYSILSFKKAAFANVFNNLIFGNANGVTVNGSMIMIDQHHYPQIAIDKQGQNLDPVQFPLTTAFAQSTLEAQREYSPLRAAATAARTSESPYLRSNRRAIFGVSQPTGASPRRSARSAAAAAAASSHDDQPTSNLESPVRSKRSGSQDKPTSPATRARRKPR